MHKYNGCCVTLLPSERRRIAVFLYCLWAGLLLDNVYYASARDSDGHGAMVQRFFDFQETVSQDFHDRQREDAQAAFASVQSELNPRGDRQLANGGRPFTVHYDLQLHPDTPAAKRSYIENELLPATAAVLRRILKVRETCRTLPQPFLQG